MYRAFRYHLIHAIGLFPLLVSVYNPLYNSRRYAYKYLFVGCGKVALGGTLFQTLLPDSCFLLALLLPGALLFRLLALQHT